MIKLSVILTLIPFFPVILAAQLNQSVPAFTYHKKAAKDTFVSKAASLKIWYTHPANATVSDDKNGWKNDAEWLKAIPIGNGFIGAMVFGDVNKERIQLNEKSLWSGSPEDGNNPAAFPALGQIRRLLWDGKYKEAASLTEKTQICKGDGSGRGNGASAPYGSFQTLGDWWLDFGQTTGYSDYRRELDLNRGVVQVSYLQNGVHYKREIFASYPDRALVMHLSSDRKGRCQLQYYPDQTRKIRYWIIKGSSDDGRNAG